MGVTSPLGDGDRHRNIGMGEMVDRIAVHLNVDIAVLRQRQRHGADQIIVDRRLCPQHQIGGFAQVQQIVHAHAGVQAEMRDGLFALGQALGHDLADFVHRHDFGAVVAGHKGRARKRGRGLADQRQHIGLADPAARAGA